LDLLIETAALKVYKKEARKGEKEKEREKRRRHARASGANEKS